MNPSECSSTTKTGPELLQLIQNREKELHQIRNAASNTLIENEAKLKRQLCELRSDFEHNLMLLQKRDKFIGSLQMQINQTKVLHEKNMSDIQKLANEKAKLQLETFLEQNRKEVEKEFQFKWCQRHQDLIEENKIRSNEQLKEFENDIRSELNTLHEHEMIAAKKTISDHYENIFSKHVREHQRQKEQQQIKLNEVTDKLEESMKYMILKMKKREEDLKKDFNRDHISILKQVEEKNAITYTTKLQELHKQYNQALQEQDKKINILTIQVSKQHHSNENLTKNILTLTRLKEEHEKKISELIQTLHDTEKDFVARKKELDANSIKALQDIEQWKQKQKDLEVNWKKKEIDHTMQIQALEKDFECKAIKLENVMNKYKEKESEMKTEIENERQSKALLGKQMNVKYDLLEESFRETKHLNDEITKKWSSEKAKSEVLLNDLEKAYHKIHLLRNSSKYEEWNDERHFDNSSESKLRRKFHHKKMKLVQKYDTELQEIIKERDIALHEAKKLRKKVNELERLCTHSRLKNCKDHDHSIADDESTNLVITKKNNKKINKNSSGSPLNESFRNKSVDILLNQLNEFDNVDTTFDQKEFISKLILKKRSSVDYCSLVQAILIHNSKNIIY